MDQPQPTITYTYKIHRATGRIAVVTTGPLQLGADQAETHFLLVSAQRVSASTHWWNAQHGRFVGHTASRTRRFKRA